MRRKGAGEKASAWLTRLNAFTPPPNKVRSAWSLSAERDRGKINGHMIQAVPAQDFLNRTQGAVGFQSGPDLNSLQGPQWQT